MKNALITGIAGQDGGYLARELIENGRRVWGLDIDYSGVNAKYIPDGVNDLFTTDIRNPGAVGDVFKKIYPDEVYNLAAHTFVGSSWQKTRQVMDANAIGVLNFLETIKLNNPNCRFYQASTSEMFGNSETSPQDERTPLLPVSPYGVAKVAAHHLVRVYRESFGLFACAGICFNHESARRPEIFVTRKITTGVARIARAIKNGEYFETLKLGNLQSERDWSHAADMVVAMRLIMEADEPQDFVIASCESHTVEEFCELAFDHANIPIEWSGEGIDQVGCLEDGLVVVEVSKEFYRPNELHQLCGDPTRIVKKMGWKPQYSFEDLVSEMMTYDLKAVGLGI